MRKFTIAAAILVASWSVIETRSGEIRFNRDIRPLLSDRCFHCHGPDKASRKAKLQLDDPANAFAPRGSEDERAIVPRQPDKSLVVRRIFEDDPDEIMPPPESHLSLSAAEKALIRDWISQGAKYEPHWAFIPPAAPVVPEVKDSSWPRNDIDKFVLARLEREGVKPSREAEKARWLRRVTFDLNGVPPGEEELLEFLADASKGAYERVVDRLLKSSRYGERMAVPWLDAARYADSYGYQSDQLSPTWPFRDWVVNAYNRNLPYDQFLTEQLAGDLLPNPTREQRLATAFNRLHRQTNEGGSVEEEWRTEYVADRVQTFGSVFMGLTFECARCHDHKFDPITQKDFYSLSAFFNNIDENGTYNGTAHVPTPSLLLPTPEQEAAMSATVAAREEAKNKLKQAIVDAEGAFQEWSRVSNRSITSSGLVAHFNFDALVDTNFIANQVNNTNRTAIEGNSLAEGKLDKAIRFTGDDVFKVSNVMGSMTAADQYGITFWMRIPAMLKDGLIFHSTQGTDTSYHGTELAVKEGRLFFVIKRFWPGNAIATETTEAIPADEWTQVGVSYDGSGDAQGMRMFVNGRGAPTRTVRNSLTKDPQNGDASLYFGARSRSFGLKGGMIDDLRIYNRPITALEVAQLFEPNAKIAPQTDDLRDYFLTAVSNPVAEARENLRASVKAYFGARNSVQETSVMEELAERRPAYLLDRGRYDAPKNEKTRVERSTPEFLPPLPEDLKRDRLALAKWLTQTNHPLTARVAVNRYWQALFERGLVSTPDNFGAQGMMPSTPELLDWLALDFVRSGWDTKALLKKIVLSATYRQDSALRSELKQRDPENILLARGPSHRLPAEMVRDAALAGSGLLSEKLGGPPVSPFMPGDLWRESNAMSPAYRQSVGEDLYRRSVYTVVKRTAPMPNMISFDAPGREVCVLKRSTTGTPQQAFVLLNDPQFVEAARVLAEKMLSEGGEKPADKVRFVFRRFAGRDPNPNELKLLRELWDEQRKIFAAEPERAKKLIATGGQKANDKLDPIELAAATELAQAIFNLDATIWKR